MTDTATADTFDLTPPTEVEKVSKKQAASVQALQPDEQEQTEAQKKAQTFVSELVSKEAGSPDFTSVLSEVTGMGSEAFRSTSDSSNRMLQRPVGDAEKGSPQARVGKSLTDLRVTVTDLDPNRADLTGVKRVLKWLPGGRKIENYFAKYQSAEEHLNAIIRSLASGQDELRKDNSAIDVERAEMWDGLKNLAEYNALASALDVALVAEIDKRRENGDVEGAQSIESDALFAVRQRHQDIMTQMAVATQGYLALDVVRKNNLELIKGVDRAQTTTVSALRTAIIVSQALSQQKLVLKQIDALNGTTSNMIEQTSINLRQQGAEINQQAASTTVEVEKLQNAFNNVFATMDAIDSFRSQANDTMAKATLALQEQVSEASDYVKRSNGQVATKALEDEGASRLLSLEKEG